MRSVELFSGAGGLALGTGMAGFEHAAVVEFDHDCCETLRLNQTLGYEFLKDWRIIESDVRSLAYDTFGRVELIAGGVPCQPFSLGGKHRAHEDERDMFPEFARAVAALRPRAFLVENVKGLLRGSFADYFEYVILRLSHPLITLKPGRSWREHRSELEKIHTSGRATGLDYNVVFQLLNAADHGVPQRRERVFIVGFRADLGVQWSFPEPTHSRDALLRDQFLTGEYWERHRIPRKRRPESITLVRERAPGFWEEDDRRPWRTVRDAITDLPSLKPGERDAYDPNHFLNPGARSYKGHTGSPWDEPAKTLKAGDHGVPGGENTLALGDGEVRYFSPRECARLQTFPDAYRITGSWTEQMRQMGNAVPVLLARVVASEIIAGLR
ncbi:MAG: DNA cytosine methyltransferase [Isosphaeraceae bacterium]